MMTRFNEHGLPNAACRRVPPPLFADGQFVIFHRALDTKDQQARAGAIRFLRETVGEIKLKRSVTALMMSKRMAVAPAIGEKIRCTDGENHALAVPGLVIGNRDASPIPSHFIARCGAMIFGCDFEGIDEWPGRVVIFAACGVAFPPGGERFPAERNQDLLAPFRIVRHVPAFLDAPAFAIETKLPWSVEVQPVMAFQRSTLPFRPWIFRPRISELVQHGRTPPAALQTIVVAASIRRRANDRLRAAPPCQRNPKGRCDNADRPPSPDDSGLDTDRFHAEAHPRLSRCEPAPQRNAASARAVATPFPSRQSALEIGRAHV